MKYLNREYGFAGRPPFFPEFTEELDSGAGLAEDFFPNKATVGHGFYSGHPSYLFFQGLLGSMWGVGFQLKKSGKFVDIGNIYELAADKLFITQGARYLRAELSEGILEVSIAAENSAVFAFVPKKKCKIKLAVKPLGYANSTLQSENSLVRGNAYARGVIGGVIELADSGAIMRDRFAVLDDGGERKEFFTLKAYTEPQNTEVSTLSVKYEYALAAGEALYGFAIIGNKTDALDIPTKERAVELLAKQNAAARETAEEDGSGTMAGGYRKALTEVRKHLMYDPYLMSVVLSEDMREENGYYSYDGTERALGAIIAATAGEYAAAEAMAKTAATDPILGAISVLTVYRHTHNKEMVQAVLPRLMEEWALNDKLVVADQSTKRELCYKQYGSPLKDDLFNRGAIYSVDMSSYKLLAFRIIGQLLSELGVDASDYLEKAEGLQKNINFLLYRAELGIYMNRYVSGEWATGYGFTSFLPLTACAVTGGERLNELLLQLKNPKKFWGGELFPTLSKDNIYHGKRNYNRNGVKLQRYENYSGMIAPWANFLMYRGFCSAGLFDCSSALAESSLRLFLSQYDKRGEYPAFYRPDGKRSTSEKKRSLCSLILPLMGANELLDCDFSIDNALRFGCTERGAHSIKNVHFYGKSLTLKKEDAMTSLYFGTEEVLRGEPGNFEIRGFTETEKLTFLFRAQTSVKLTLKTPIFAVGMTRKIVFHIEAGKHKVSVKDGRVEIARIAM